ncbi:hypothetical protein [Hymenobacter terricola]|uniref:hypothetical protein n=1 Tax=Hymenobacter terricola TaxID=2819236 RepID=UPI001B30627F|nr:hypothetical protein [Hymenobacter terricola]
MLQRYRPLIPVIFLVICCINTIATVFGGTVTIDGIAYGYTLNAKHYGAFAATLATIASFFFLKHYYRYFLLFLFALGIFGLINFTASEISSGLNFGEVHVGMSPVLMVFGPLVYIFNYQKINSAIFSVIKSSDEKIASIQQEEISEFKNRFARKSSEELAQIVALNKLVPPALTAARQLLKERH